MRPELVSAHVRSEPGRKLPSVEEIAHDAVTLRPVIPVRNMVTTQFRAVGELETTRCAQSHTSILLSRKSSTFADEGPWGRPDTRRENLSYMSFPA
jgi:hypothetical protein